MDRMQDSQSGAHQHRRSRWALIGFLSVAAFFLFSEHRAHFLGILPYLLVLACPLMHLFHHGHHGHTDSGQGALGKGNPTEARSGPREEQ